MALPTFALSAFSSNSSGAVSRLRRLLGTVRFLLRVMPAALAAYVVVRELQKPAEERVWHGRLFDFIPYDFRPPTFERIKATYWNPNNRHLLTGQVFGLGWTVNLYEAQRRVRELAGAA